MTTHEPTAQDELTAKQSLLAEQREANEHLLLAALRAQEQTEQARTAWARADAIALELRASEARYRTLFEVCPAGVYTCDASGVIQEFNHHATTLWGRVPAQGDTDERFCGSFKLFRPQGGYVPHEHGPMAEVVSGKVYRVQDEEVLIERPDGSRVTVVVNIRPITNERGQIIGAINYFYDVTTRKVAERQLTDSLTRERELAEFREMFIGILGHDLRTPLASIMGTAAGMLRRAQLVEQDGEAVSRIIRSSQRMTRMIARLLDLTRARLGGGLSIEPGRADLREICQCVVEEFETPIDLACEGDLAGIWDHDRLVEVLSNLVGNAMRFAAPGTAVVVTARDAGAEVVVEVTNEGEPISPEVLPFIFEPFRKAAGHGKVAGALGLGLYIAHQLVLEHRGTLTGHSAGGMTTFVMRLPRTRSPGPEGAASAGSTSSGGASSPAP